MLRVHRRDSADIVLTSAGNLFWSPKQVEEKVISMAREQSILYYPARDKITIFFFIPIHFVPFAQNVDDRVVT